MIAGHSRGRRMTLMKKTQMESSQVIPDKEPVGQASLIEDAERHLKV